MKDKKHLRTVFLWGAFFVFTFISGVSHAQQYTIHGYIKDADTNEPLPYANIMIEGTKQGTASNLEGAFSLKVDDTSCRLIVSYVCYSRDTVSVAFEPGKLSTYVTVLLKSEPVLADEVVIIADYAENLLKNVYKKMEKRQNERYYAQEFSRSVSQCDSVIVTVRESIFDALVSPIRSHDISHIRRRSVYIKNFIEKPRREYWFSRFGILAFYGNVPIIQSEFNYPRGDPWELIFPLRKDPEKYYYCEFSNFRKHNGKTVVTLEVKPKNEPMKNYYYGKIDVLEDEAQVLQAEYYLVNPDLISESYLDKYHFEVDSSWYSHRWSYRQLPDNSWVIDRTERNYFYRLRSIKDVNKVHEFRNHAVEFYFNYMDKKHFVPDDRELIADSLFKRIETQYLFKTGIGNVIFTAQEYNPEFWIKNIEVVNEIPLENKLIQFFRKNGFYGDLFPGGIKLSPYSYSAGIESLTIQKLHYAFYKLQSHFIFNDRYIYIPEDIIHAVFEKDVRKMFDKTLEDIQAGRIQEDKLKYILQIIYELFGDESPSYYLPEEFDPPSFWTSPRRNYDMLVINLLESMDKKAASKIISRLGLLRIK